MDPTPAYLTLKGKGELTGRAEEARLALANCALCPRRCQVNRSAGDRGACGIGRRARVSSFGAHFGEEDPLRGWRGSGTIFFSGCNLHCQFCQNAAISQEVKGSYVDRSDLGEMMLELQDQGCHNLNLVSPTHVLPQILEGLVYAADRGLELPLVYNSGGFDRVSSLRLLDGVVDIYMPDMKYADPGLGKALSLVEDYPQVNRQAVLEMHRQVGDLQCNSKGIAQRGLLIRHLLLPEAAEGTRQILEFIAREVSQSTYLNLMDQYRPAYRAREHPQLRGRVSSEEVKELKALARSLGLTRLDGSPGAC